MLKDLVLQDKNRLNRLLILAVLTGMWSVPASPATPLRVALLQMHPEGNHISANLAKAEVFCRKAAQQGADIAVMPEMWSIGYTRFDPDAPGAREAFYALALATDSPEIAHFAALAKELEMAIGVTYLQSYEPLPRNAITLFDRHGKEVFTYAKVHTSDFKPMEASMTPGERFFVGDLDTRAGSVKAGAMICFDREEPESARLLMLQGAEIILTPNACTLEEMRLMQFRVRAWENALAVAMANYPAPEQNGASVAYDASGECRALGDEKEGIFIAEFDLEALRKRRAKTIYGNAYRRPHRYDALTSPEKAPVWQRMDGNGKPYDASVR